MKTSPLTSCVLILGLSSCVSSARDAGDDGPERIRIILDTDANGKCTNRPRNPRKIVIWENFDKESIMKDFYTRMDNYVLVEP